MAYIINKTDGTQLTVLEDGTVNTSTSVGLVGRNYTGYGEIQNENFVILLENSANSNPPARPLPGQTWFNTANKTLNVYSGEEWAPVGSAVLSGTTPEGIEGTLWFKTTTKQLFVYQDNGWNLVGPEGAEGFGVTKIRSRQVRDNFGTQKIVLEVLVDGFTIGVISNTAFILDDSTPIAGFSSLGAGFTSASNKNFKGSLDGNAATATRLETSRTINGVFFDGQANITIKSSTTKKLFKGTYLTGTTFDGSEDTTWSVDASSLNVIGKIVARDSAGNFSAGTITADLIGDVAGNVTATSGTSSFNRVEAVEFVGATLTGNADSATKLNTARTINGVAFDGTQNIIVPADAGTLTGNTLANNIINLGTLANLDVGSAGSITIGGPNINTAAFQMFLGSGSVPTIRSRLGVLNFDLGSSGPDITFMDAATAFSYGAENNPALVAGGVDTNIGMPSPLFGEFNKVYAKFFEGTAASARYADLAENYLADAEYEPGTVLEFGGNCEVTIAEDETRRVAGVVSQNPAYLMNSELQGEHVVALALQGRVPCKVRGKIRKGDMLVSGGNGYARPTVDPKIGTIIGKALEDFDGIEGVIEVVVGRI